MLAAVRRRLLPLPLGALAAAFCSPTSADPTVSYLISRCGLSPDAAARAAASVRLASPGAAAQADAVLALLRRYGFSDADISSTVRKLPVVLLSHPAKTLQPKLDFLASVGVSAPLLPRLISLTPVLLHRSVEDHLAPLFAALREVLGGSDARVVTALRQMPFVGRCQPKSTLLLGLPLLRDVQGTGVCERCERPPPREPSASRRHRREGSSSRLKKGEAADWGGIAGADRSEREGGSSSRLERVAVRESALWGRRGTALWESLAHMSGADRRGVDDPSGLFRSRDLAVST